MEKKIITIWTEEDRRRGINNFSRKIKELEWEWRRSLFIADAELLKIFPEAKPIILRNLTAYEKEKVVLGEQLKNQWARVTKKFSDEDQWFALELVKYFSPLTAKIAALNRRIRCLKRFVWLMQAPKNNRQIDWQALIEKAKAASIEQIAGPYLKSVRKLGGGKIMALCPFHSERTPSFCLYLSTNSFHCFGCQTSGNVINFVRKIHDCSFREAVEYLARY